MMKEALLTAFFDSFGLTAYEENTVPSDAKFPYLTYPVVTDSMWNAAPLTLSLWYRGESWVPPANKVDEIGKFIGSSGVVMACDGGGLWFRRGSPFSQNMGDPSDDLIKRKIINITVEFITTD